MADKKISELTELTTPDGTEELVVNDSGVSKKITQTNLLSTALPLAGGTMTGTIAGFTSTGIDDNATSTAMTIDSAGIVTMPYQPAFLAKMSASQTNLAINTAVKIQFDTEIFDQGADFDTTTNTFTAPVTGKYFLAMNLNFENLDTAAGFYQFHLRTSNQDFASTNRVLFAADPAYWSWSYSGVFDMDAGDTVYIDYYQNAGAAQVDTRAGNETTFSGYLVA